ncbi:MAG: UDP-N-acetylmuramate--L-alanine ligase [Alphaproteobacteria bacterium]|nr:UDP-N-acetylmuramate--L-alanine ligase [Alphaproteobacteria bacterium]
MIGLLHFVGIGGIGMSGIAEILHALGYAVQGSDLSGDSANVQRLRNKGLSVFTGHDAAHIEGATVVVVSSAVKPDNPELKAARAARIPVVRRADMLAELMRLKTAIAIGGTHGKTTTTSLIGSMLEEGGLDPTVINGGIVNSYGTNTRLGAGEWMVVEADESDGTFTRLPATAVVVTNMDPEHMEHYGCFDNLRKAYKRYVENVPFYGFAVLCLDHPEVQSLVPELTDRRIVTYGFNPQADVRALNLRSGADGSTFDVAFADKVVNDVYLPMLGRHNVQNALAALAVGRELEMTESAMKKALRHFGGVKRRFTKTGESHGVTVIDDYGHHPVEIAAVLKAARSAVTEGEGRVIAVMQPHRYSRLNDLMDAFCTCFNDADSVIVADVYAAGESPITGADKAHLTAGIKAHGHRDVVALDTREDLARLVAARARPGDYVICLGAGDITKWAYALPAELDGAFSKNHSPLREKVADQREAG